MIEVDTKSFCGSGRSGNVYQFSFDGNEMALKLCSDKELFDEIENEANILKILNKMNCSYVPKLKKAYRENENYFLVSQFINGEHLPFDENMPLLRKFQYIEALEAIHNCGVLHGDIREENFIATKDKVYVIDFGFSKLNSSRQERDAEMNELRSRLGFRPISRRFTNSRSNRIKIN